MQSCFRNDAQFGEQSPRLRVVPAEASVQHGLIFGAAARKDVVPERTGYFGAEDALLPEQGECVGLEYLGPLP